MKVFSSLKEARESDEPVSYVAGKTGLKLYRRFGQPEAPIHYDMTKDIKETPYELPEVAEEAYIHSITPLPDALVARVLSIFRRVYEEHRSEMIVILEWDAEKKQYELARPKFCTIGPGYLRYRQERANVGTIHSHAGFGAGFSSTDDANEKNQPGIYMVIGNLGRTKNPPSIVASITGLGDRYTIDPPDLSNLHAAYELSDDEYKWWMERVQLRSIVEAKKDGWFVLDWQGDILWWVKDEAEARLCEEPGLTITSYENLDEAKKKAKSNWAPLGSSYTYSRPTETKPATPTESKPKSKASAASDWIPLLVRALEDTEAWDLFVGEVFDYAVDELPEERWQELAMTFGGLSENLLEEMIEKDETKCPECDTELSNEDKLRESCPLCAHPVLGLSSNFKFREMRSDTFE